MWCSGFANALYRDLFNLLKGGVPQCFWARKSTPQRAGMQGTFLVEFVILWAQPPIPQVF
jgi:hypothetical protein